MVQTAPSIVSPLDLKFRTGGYPPREMNGCFRQNAYQKFMEPSVLIQSAGVAWVSKLETQLSSFSNTSIASGLDSPVSTAPVRPRRSFAAFAAIASPSIHKPAPLVEQVAASVGGFSLVPDRVG
jgi:hypothetical protein